ncbi:transposase, partial [Burkholderia sp. MSh2]
MASEFPYPKGKENSTKKRHTDEQIIRILREAESREEPVKDLCRRHDITEQTFYRWRNKFGGMDVAEA